MTSISSMLFSSTNIYQIKNYILDIELKTLKYIKTKYI